MGWLNFGIHITAEDKSTAAPSPSAGANELLLLENGNGIQLEQSTDRLQIEFTTLNHILLETGSDNLLAENGDILSLEQ